jgi:hypothetical protein
MRIVANTQLTGIYGTVVAGEEFDCPDGTALELLRLGRARRVAPPAVRYETKVIVPEAPEVSAREGFRHLRVPDKKSANVAPEGHRLLARPDIPKQRTAHSRGRR